MNTGLISYRYATALLQYAEQHNQSETVYSEAKNVVNAYIQVAKIRAILANPFMPKAEKRSLILLTAGEKPSKTFENFLDLIIKNGREGNFQWIMQKYIDLYRKQKDVHLAKLTTASEMDAATEKRLLETVRKTIGGTVEIEQSVDADILGGFVFEVDFVRCDASLARQLETIKKEYLEKNGVVV